MVAVLCAVAGIAAHTTFADPVNSNTGKSFKKGASLKAYSLPIKKGALLKDWFTVYATRSPAKHTIDISSSFNLTKEKLDDVSANIGEWSGYINIDRDGDYTFTLHQKDNYNKGGFLMKINDHLITPAPKEKQVSENVNLRKGLQRIVIVCRPLDNKGNGNNSLSVTYQKKSSGDNPETPIAITPASMLIAQ